MPYFCPNCQSPISSTKLSDAEPVELTCSDCRSRWMRDELQEEETLPEGARLGGFEIISPLGVGGMGQVYLATQLSLDRQVALKTLPSDLSQNEQAMKRFLEEVRHTAALEHRSIITVFEAGKEDGVGYLAMDFVDGASLDRMLKRNKEAIPEAEAVRVARSVADALRHAWKRQRLLHRDIKPANIMIDKGGRIRLLDLGIAKRPAETRSGDRSSLTQKGMAIGTPHYMSPEQARGEPDLDSRSDQYALGATLYHIVSNERPFEGTSVVEILAKQVTQEPKPVRKVNPKVSAGLARIIARMMQKDKNDRFETWQELIDELDQLRSGKKRQRKAPAKAAPQQEVVIGKRGTPGRIAVLALLLFIVGVLCLLHVILPDRASATNAGLVAPVLVQRPIERPPDPIPVADPAALVKAAASANESPLEIADRFAKSGDLQNFVATLEAVIAIAPGNDARWAHAAATRLDSHYRKTGDKQALEQLLLARLEPAHPDDQALPEDFLRAADFYVDGERPKDAERLLWGGLRYGAKNNPEVAAACADRLVRDYRTAGDRPQLRLALHHAIEALPEGHESKKRFAKEMAVLGGATEESTDTGPTAPPVDDELRQLAELVQQTTNLSEKRNLQQRYARMLTRRQRHDDAIAVFLDLVDSASTEAAKAEASHALARCYKDAGEDALRLEVLARLATLPAEPKLVPHATTAGRLLAKYYESQNNPFLRNRYLLDIADGYGKSDPIAAADALFQVAAYHEKKGRHRTALEVLRRIPSEFAAAGTQATTRAKREISRLDTAHPSTPTIKVDVPPDAFLVDGNRKYLRMGRAIPAISEAKAVTVSFWLRAPDQRGQTCPLVSRFNPGNNRGFHLALEYDRTISLTVGNGSRPSVARGGIKVPLDTWTHVAAQAADGKLTVYVNGKVAGIGVYPNDLEQDGAGRLHVGRQSWVDGAKPFAWFRYVTVYPEAIHNGAFEPADTPIEFAKAAICITKRADRVGDLRRNRVEYP